MANSINTKVWFSHDKAQGGGPGRATLDVILDISGSDQVTTNLANFFATVDSAECFSGSLANKAYVVGVPRGQLASTAKLMVLSSSADAVGITGSVSIGTLSDKITLGIRFQGPANTDITGSVVG